MYFCKMNIHFSIVVPVYNRPDETRELLESIAAQTYDQTFEVVIVEDGSQITSEAEVAKFQSQLDIHYLRKSNSGPGDSRNYGMRLAKGSYFIILDSDCILPEHYLESVASFLDKNFVHCFGGPDAALDSFSTIQKAINYSMTSFFTTGGIRGSKKSVNKFQPRSFNMGISKEAFLATGGYGKIHPGEDPDLTIRLWETGYETALIEDAFVYHKRRISWEKFYKQVNKFGQTRPILNNRYPYTAKITYWFPALFCIGFVVALSLLFFGQVAGILLYASYFIVIIMHSARENKSWKVGLMTLIAVCIQFFGYGYGFLRSTLVLRLVKKSPEELFPHLFFK